MNSHFKQALLLFIFSIGCNISWAQTDSVLRKCVGINIGYIQYASIDEIFTPFIYSGNSANYEIYKQIISNKDIREYSVSLANVNRVPLNVKLYQNFIGPSYDPNQGNDVIKADAIFRNLNTVLMSSSFKYLRAFKLFQNNKHCFYYGITADFFAGIRSSVADPELFSLTFNPALAYRIDLGNRFNLIAVSSLALFGINLRKPYSGAEAQLIDKYSISYYYNYAFSNYKIDFVNTYVRQTYSIVLQSKVSNRIYFSVGYKLQYLDLQSLRKLTSATSIVNAGLSVKLN